MSEGLCETFFHKEHSACSLGPFASDKFSPFDASGSCKGAGWWSGWISLHQGK